MIASAVIAANHVRKYPRLLDIQGRFLASPMLDCHPKEALTGKLTFSYDSHTEHLRKIVLFLDANNVHIPLRGQR